MDTIKMLFREAPRSAWVATVFVVVAIGVWVAAIIVQGWEAVLWLVLMAAFYAASQLIAKWAARKDGLR